MPGGIVQIGPLVRTVTAQTIEEYEEILGIGNPLHLDSAFAQASLFKGAIAHGMMMLAYVSEMMAGAFADGWYEGGELDTTFVRPVKPGDTITTWGTITGQRPEQGGVTAVCEVHCENQKGEAVLKGTALAHAYQVIAGVPKLSS